MATEELKKTAKLDLRKFNTAEQQVQKGLDSLGGIKVVDNQEILDVTMKVLAGAKTVEKLIESKRKEIVKPFNDEVKKVNTYAKELINKLPIEVDRVKGLVVTFQQEQRAIELKAQREEEERQHKLREEEEARQLEIEKQKKDTEDIAEFLSDEELEKRNKDIADLQNTKKEEIAPIEIVETKVKGIRKTWKHEVKDTSAVPREYLIVDEKAIRQAIKDGVRDIPGVRIYEEESLAIRTN